jgi:hypothetical protein
MPLHFPVFELNVAKSALQKKRSDGKMGEERPTCWLSPPPSPQLLAPARPRPGSREQLPPGHGESGKVTCQCVWVCSTLQTPLRSSLCSAQVGAPALSA